MSKAAVIYWSGTGNTEAMANAVVEGAKAKGAEVSLFTADEFTGEVTACDEGELRWVPEAEVPLLPTWAGDRIFLNLLLEGEPFFHLSLKYEGETLVGYRLEA